jgi:hypothetical protein
MKRFLLSFVLMGILAVNAPAQEAEAASEATESEPTAAAEATEGKARLKYEITGSGNIMFGQVVSGYAHSRWKSNPIDHRWQDFYGGNIYVTSNPNPWFTAKVGLEVRSAFPITQTSGIMKETYRVQYRSFLPVAEGIMNWDFGSAASLLVESGLFQYNFNPDIKNLGNYLYRGMAYPLYLETKLDYPWYDMMGIRTECSLLDKQVKVGLIVNSNIAHAPFFDFSLAFTGSYTLPNKALEIGAGLCLDRLMSVSSAATDGRSFYGTPGYDSSWTLRSTKLDTRLVLDIKPFFGNPSFMGAQDAKIYAEAAILGFKDPKYYIDSTFSSTLMHRLPILFGVNFPVFKVLDVFSFEFEWFGSPYPNDWWGGIDGAPSPMPYYDLSSFDTSWVNNYKTGDNIKWTLYAKKSISKFDIVGIMANDHTVYETYSAETHPNTEQSLRRGKNWHWYLKLQYNL